ncbi:bifunctional diguanylate cyclase/phosphohydrolase [Acetobacterium bakii]|uniref:Diguanylate cyclase n=1 Tax=Acetobacterium bakii TaxID=52689 RepID=A0A0L6U096_9FIRM|nr:diguanylate cyclase [Acetobacterium bakii]KNZ41767.1 hypothetical protein AKG39_09015 [Acetobacterium bakii]
MEKFDQNKEISLQQLLISIKLALLFFSVIAFSQHYFKNKEILDLLSNGSKTIFIFVLIIIVIYGVVFFSNKVDPDKQLGLFKYGELAFFVVLSFLTVFYTGAFASNFKPLFLCVILLATIGHGLTIGMVIAGILSLGLLSMDLIMVPNQTVNLYFEYDLVLSSIFLLVTFTVGYYAKLENDHIEELRDLANEDALTGLFNHRYFYANLYQEIDEAKKNGVSVSLFFLDIDDFKIYNDLYGHTVGDRALKKMAKIIMDFAGTEFVACRYGGEEFAILLYNTEEKQAMESANKLCSIIEQAVFDGQEYLPGQNLTVSVGVSEYPNKAKDANDLVSQADQALYRAKFFRKNRVESYASILDNLKNSLSEEDETIITTLRTLISVINSRDKHTYEHVERVAEYASWMAEELNLPKHLKQTLVYGAYMHDIGKINTPKEVLLKSEKLTEEEWKELQQHPIQGVEIIEHVDVIKDVQPLILQHHEYYNGKGYPYGLAGNQIAYTSRILSVVDAFDAMTSLRPYQRKRSVEEACEELIRCRGTQFDPNVVDVFIGIVIKKFNIELNVINSGLSDSNG